MDCPFSLKVLNSINLRCGFLDAGTENRFWNVAPSLSTVY